jgi:DNA-binding transcriptional MerR regulator
MRISELAHRAGVALPTVKYYLREGLLPLGQATAATQAEYDESHVERLRLIRALVGVAGLSLASVRTVLGALDEGPVAAVAAAHGALTGVPARAAAGEPPARALAALERLGWTVSPDSAALLDLEAALAAVEEVGIPAGEAQIDGYGAAALRVAEVDISTVPGGEPSVRHVVLGTVLYEPILLALRRLAQQHLYRRSMGPQEAKRFGPTSVKRTGRSM